MSDREISMDKNEALVMGHNNPSKMVDLRGTREPLVDMILPRVEE